MIIEKRKCMRQKKEDFDIEIFSWSLVDRRISTSDESKSHRYKYRTAAHSSATSQIIELNEQTFRS